MKTPALVALSLWGALALSPGSSDAQVNISINLGPQVVVTDYSASAYGDWHTNYQEWRPVTLYVYQGRWYARSMQGARPVMVYRSRDVYFLPPREPEWRDRDHRFNNKRRPTDDDYRHAGPPGKRKHK